MRQRDEISDAEWNFFLRGSGSLDKVRLARKTWQRDTPSTDERRIKLVEINMFSRITHDNIIDRHKKQAKIYMYSMYIDIEFYNVELN